ncbi:unnamed protein product [Cyberlindnera jadinii]|uniref:Zinc-ribbon 15 domain-containing protein n=1 Tax=Cyberlindnera jadinii (strain ATCC 18201 / CBS 1600 / BCRC 20928 / JCM 3617 / NBRC 0987 / NRRL Y-1542) TaxID=983966 RepID=A0A1E4RZJ9_CYBJN|nr:hypothetical protein CYBJADRAFT_168573 [Cyberlindnera jadinii NRRL Y-1542]XP_020070481.1 hypothetical protein CYBJADRAFT_167994 [Cyberlindnera jadinii NRRL Y-1542]ODV72671.1 hypothetical protein CYBJADRAFT_168573 [Cyberlindnera jadinii NRRL Y-1542]ODV73442.1 hypothetical protein CYBJADRAFT_167994 [Cyberlindnera jadinii NRRL Y-1542]CEP24611.1 unnamed protein product [Cyberlindnera jadinii]
MFMFFLFGTKNFTSHMDGYPNNLQCPNCHNNSVEPVKEKEFISVWFVPIIPIYWGKQLKCRICSWTQDLKKGDLEKYNIQKH